MKRKIGYCFWGIIALVLCVMLCDRNVTFAAKKVSLNKTEMEILVGTTKQLKVLGTKKKAKWSSNKKSVAVVSGSGKVTAKKRGNAVITAKVGKKKLTCKVKVREATQAEQILKLVNKERTERGLAKVKLDIKLNRAANKRAKEISQKFDHIRPDGSSCFTMLEEENISYRMAAENIAAGRATAKEVMYDWMHSKQHKSSIVNPDVKKMGVGYQKNSDSTYTYYWVQIFTD